MKRILLAAACLVLCFSMAGCGKDGDDSGKTQEKPEAVEEHDEESGSSNVKEEPEEKPEAVTATSIVGAWKCVDLTMEDNGQEMGKEELEEFLGVKAEDMVSLKAYDDGTGEFTYLGEASGMTWTEADGGYTIALELPDEEAAAQMSAGLKDGRLVVSSEENYLSDDVEMKTVTTYTLEYQGKVSKILENWNLELSEEEVLAMNNQIAFGQYVIADGYLYGQYGGEEGSDGDFMMTEITAKDKPEIGEIKKVEEAIIVTYLTEHDGYVYGLIDNKKIVKVKAGETKAETVFEGDCNSIQIAGDKIYYTDGDYHLCTMDLKGKNSEKLLEKAVYYVYVLPNNTVLYQDDADNESLHIYDLKTGTDVKLNDEPSYQPMIYGDHVYYAAETGEEIYAFSRVNLYSGAVETAPGDMDSAEFFIDNDKITFGFGGMPAVSVEEWDKLSTMNYGGFTFGPRYSNGQIRIFVDPYDKVRATCKSFQNMDHGIELGYL